MPRACKVSPTLNHDRLAIIRKGSVKISDLQKFIPASRNVAAAEYANICSEILRKEGREVGQWGIEVDRILERYHMTEQKILRWAQQEEKILKGESL